jgi:tryptophan halogenase
MISKVDKIVIVGGGTAGWMTATTLIKYFPNKEVVVIESDSIKSIGVGESTTALIRNWLNSVGISDENFMKECDASYKLSIEFKDFYENKDGGYHYPFGKPFTDNMIFGINSWFYKKHIDKSITRRDFVNTHYPQSHLFEKNKISLNENGQFDNFNFKNDTAFHFDAKLFAKLLKEKYCIPNGVKHIVADVVNINMDKSGISSLDLNTLESISGDLYIDCTGFKSILLGDAMKTKWISYEDRLPNNKAWAAIVPYTDKELELQPYTRCTGLSSGWAWNTPCYSRIGTGYVYSDKYIKDEDALQEFKNYLDSDKMTIQKNRSKDLKFINVSFKNGIYEKVWNKNVLAIGLSAGFLEPLESNGIFKIQDFIRILVQILENSKITQWDIDSFNYAAIKRFNFFADFILSHYMLSKRNDTRYWSDISNMSFDGYDKRLFQSIRNDKFINKEYKESDIFEGFICVAVGMGLNYVDPIVIKEIEGHYNFNTVDRLKQTFEYMDMKKAQWDLHSKNSISLNSYLTYLYT